VIPVADVIPCRTRPWAVLGLAVATVAVFAWQLAIPDLNAAGSGGPVATALLSVLVHAGWLHLASTLVPLAVLGPAVEDRLGHGRFVVLYLLAHLMAGNVGTWASPDGSALLAYGATGAAAGVLGGSLLLFPRSKVLVLIPTRSGLDATEVPSAFFGLIWFLFVVVTGVAPAWVGASTPAAAAGAAGGFVTGAGAAWILRQRARDEASWWSP